MGDKFRPDEKMTAVLKACGSNDWMVAAGAQRQLAKALEAPLRKGVMSGDIVAGIFEAVTLEPGAVPEWPLDFLAPGTEKDFVAYTIPNTGRIPEKRVEADYVMISTYNIGASIDWSLKYARDARWDIVRRAMEVLEAMFTKKINNDGWHTLLAAAVDRNIVVFDSDAAAGAFTKRLVSLLKTVMRRNSGGNSTSTNRGKLTDLYVSPEAMEDIRNWGVDQIDEITRHEIYMADDGSVNRVFQVNLHDIDELGEGQEFQLFYLNTLGASLASSDVELVVGLDLSRSDSFVMPVRQGMQVFEDPVLHRQLRQGYYGYMELGFGALDNRRCLVGSF